MPDTTGAEPERRLIAIDAETVDRVRKMLTSYSLSSYDYDALLSLAWKAWEEGITSDESMALRVALAAPEVLSDYGKEQVDGAREKLAKFAPLIKPSSDPAPQEAE